MRKTLTVIGFTTVLVAGFSTAAAIQRYINGGSRSIKPTYSARVAAWKISATAG